jgi:hypothetical protein
MLNSTSRKIAITAASTLLLLTTSQVPADAPDHSAMPEMNANPTTPNPAQPASIGQTLLERVRSLEGKWDAQTKLGVLTDIFKPFALGTAVLGEEWLNGKQITSTVFYVVNGELRADHYCDYLNQPRYTAVPSVDPAVLDFEFREATNLDTHPAHFHTSKWTLIDSTHMNQDWLILGGQKPVSQIHMEFVKRTDGAAAPDPRPPAT